MRGRVNGAGVLAVIGAGALLVGLFLSWFEPGVTAWNAFEIVDLLLATIAVGVLLVALGASSDRPRLVALAGWLPAAALAAFVIVAVSLINPPPGVGDGSLEIGAWLSLAGAALLVVGAILATTELSLVITVRPRRRDQASAVEDVQGGAPVGDVAPPASAPGWEPPPYDSQPTEPALEGAPLEEPPLEEPLEEPLDEPLEEPLEGPPVEELPPDESPLEEPVTDEEAVEEIFEPEEADAETRSLRGDERG